MKTVLYITGNDRKIWQARSIGKQFNIAVEQAVIHVPEVQAHDPLEVTIAKAEAAYALVQKPLVVCDFSWSFSALKGFPGAYMRDVTEWFEAEDFLALMRDKKDRSVMFTDSVVYIDAQGHTVFQKEFGATIVKEARGVGDVSIDQVIIFDGQQDTIAENVDANKHSRDLKQSAWYAFAQWLTRDQV
jgi:non-canonical purine NTP pyrophosphatase (RdgB/HAM1 family)